MTHLTLLPGALPGRPSTPNCVAGKAGNIRTNGLDIANGRPIGSPALRLSDASRKADPTIATSSRPLTLSAEALACIQRKPWLSERAETFERGDIPPKPATTTARPIEASRLIGRCRPRSPDGLPSRGRRRIRGGSTSALPDTMRHRYTEGQQAVLCIVAGEVKRQGVCDLQIGEISALASVGRTNVQTTLHKARRLGHIKVTELRVRGRESLTSFVVEIVSPQWLTWIKRARS